MKVLMDNGKGPLFCISEKVKRFMLQIQLGTFIPGSQQMIKSQLEINFRGLRHPGLPDREDMGMGVVVIQTVAKGLMIQVLLLPM